MDIIFDKGAKDPKGFTLIETMIVVTIVGILTAIAIPQFITYQIRGFNSAALSDLRNIYISELAFCADWQVFGVSSSTGHGGGGGAGAVIGQAGGTTIITAADRNGTNRILAIGVSRGVRLIATTDAFNRTFTAVSKHDRGNSFFGGDGDVSVQYMDYVPDSEGTFLVLGTEPSSTATDDFSLAANIGPSGNAWSIK